jgi:hypothetical protein
VEGLLRDVKREGDPKAAVKTFSLRAKGVGEVADHLEPSSSSKGRTPAQPMWNFIPRAA